MSRAHGNRTDRTLRSRFERRIEQRVDGPPSARNERRLGGYAPRGTPRVRDDVTEAFTRIAQEQVREREARPVAFRIHDYNIFHKTGSLLGQDLLAERWPYNASTIERLCRGLVLQLSPGGNDYFPPLPVDDGLSVIVMNTPALGDCRGDGLAQMTVTIRSGYVTGDAWVNLGQPGGYDSDDPW